MKKKVKWLICVELIAVIVIGIFAFTYDKKDNVIDVSLEQWESKFAEYVNGGWQIGEDALDGVGEVLLLQGPFIDLQRGDYTLTITYKAEEDQRVELYAGEYVDGFVKAGVIGLDNCLQMTSYDFRVTEDVTDFEVRIYYGEEGYFSVSDIKVEQNPNNIRRVLGYTIFIGLIIDLIVLWYVSSAEVKKYILYVTAITFLTSLPLLYLGVDDDAHDLLFHLSRIEGIYRELKLENFPVRISSTWLGGYGYPVSVYYGDVLLYIPAAIRMLGFNITTAYKAFVVMINVFSVIISETCFRKIFNKTNISYVLTLVYATASYRLLDLYIRAAAGEYCAIMFLPILALAVYRIYSDKNNCWKGMLWNATLLAIGMSGVIFAHVLTAEIVVVVLVMICALTIKRTCSKQVMTTYFVAVVETVLIAALFIVPFLDYYMNVPVIINNVVDGKLFELIQKYGVNIGEFFAFFSNPFGGSESAHFSPGPVLMLTFVVAIFICLNNKGTKEIKFLTLLSGILLLLATNIFPWDYLAYNYKIFELISQIQFPSRFLAITIVVMTVLLGYIINYSEIEKIIRIDKQRFVKLCFVLAIGSTLIFLGHYADRAGRVVYYDTAELDSHDIMSGEYLRSGTSEGVFDGYVKGENIESYDVISRVGCEMDVKCLTADTEGQIIFPILNYKGYHVTDSKGKNYEIIDSDDNFISCNVPANFDDILYLRFQEPWYWTFAFGVSVLTWVTILLVFVGYKRKNKYNI